MNIDQIVAPRGWRTLHGVWYAAPRALPFVAVPSLGAEFLE
jgi:hypothetical protein